MNIKHSLKIKIDERYMKLNFACLFSQAQPTDSSEFAMFMYRRRVWLQQFVFFKISILF